jgi:fructose-bisphosphate aldolase class II
MADTKHYTDLGLVNTKDMFKKAMTGGYAAPAYNFNNMEQLQGIIFVRLVACPVQRVQ